MYARFIFQIDKLKILNEISIFNPIINKQNEYNKVTNILELLYNITYCNLKLDYFLIKFITNDY